jgi:anti-sigma B factor antagonist
MYELMEDVRVERPSVGTAVVTFTGEHDLMARDTLSSLLESLIEDNELVVADFSQATFVDSATIHLLLNSDMGARQRGRTLRLQLGTASIVETAFELSGVLKRLEWVRTREEALGDGSGPGQRPPLASVSD